MSETSNKPTPRRRPCVIGARHWISTIPTADIQREIDHARGIWSLYRGTDRYFTHFAVTLGVYRAELLRRTAA